MANAQPKTKQPARSKADPNPVKAEASASNEHDEDNIEDERHSREQEKHNGIDVYGDDDDYGDDWEEPNLLDAPAPRPGFVQRFVATTSHGDATPQNVARQMNRGWKPRRADTVAKGTFCATISHGQFAGFIGVEGLVLMERPVSLHNKFKKRVKADNQAQMQSVESDLHMVHDPSSGLGAPTMTNKTAVTRGRPVQAADDE